MSTLTRLVPLSDREVQDWLRKIEFTSLAVALLGSPDSVKEQVFRNLSNRATEILKQTIHSYESLDAKQLMIQTNSDRLQALL